MRRSGILDEETLETSLLLQCNTDASKVQKGRRSARLSIESQRHLHRLQDCWETCTIIISFGTWATAIVEPALSNAIKERYALTLFLLFPLFVHFAHVPGDFIQDNSANYLSFSCTTSQKQNRGSYSTADSYLLLLYKKNHAQQIDNMREEAISNLLYLHKFSVFLSHYKGNNQTIYR